MSDRSDLRVLDDQHLVEAEGEAAVEVRLRTHLANLLSGTVATSTVRFEGLDSASFAVRSLENWEWPYYLADVWREGNFWEKAATALERLERACHRVEGA